MAMKEKLGRTTVGLSLVPWIAIRMLCDRKVVLYAGLVALVLFLVRSVNLANLKYNPSPHKPSSPSLSTVVTSPPGLGVRPGSRYRHLNISDRIFQAIDEIVQADADRSYRSGSLTNVTCRPLKFEGAVEDILCMKRPEFLADYRNPCWKAENGSLRCLPYFQVIGNDKCGSTDLFDRIAKHPDVLKNSGAMHKETMWWSWKRYGHWLRRPYRRENFSQYLNYFQNASTEIRAVTTAGGFHPRVTGDGTPMDFWDHSGWIQIPQNRDAGQPLYLTPHLIRHINPDVKLLLILRDPVERLFSDYFFLRLGPMTTEAFHRHVVRSILTLHQCTKQQTSLRSCLYNRQLHIRLIARIHLGFYSVFVRDWLQVFPRDQLLILRTEDYSKETKPHMKTVFKFLGLRDLPEEQLDQIANSSRKYVNKRKRLVGDMKPQTRAILQELYRPFNYKLAELLQADRFLWADVS